MHQFSIAQNIIDLALAEAEKNNGKRICSLAIKLGKASHIEPESMELCLRAAAQGTIAEQAEIEIKPLALTARCRECGHTAAAQDNELLCSGCGGENLEVLTGSEVFLESLVVD